MLPLYVNKNSRIHRIHPRTVLAYTVFTFLSSLILTDILTLLLIFTTSVVVAITGKLLGEWARIMHFSLYISITILIINMFLLPYSTTLDLLLLKIPLEPLLTSASLILRLNISISVFIILSLAVDPDRLFSTGRRSKISLSLAMGARMYPLLAEDAREIEDIMRIRGVELDRGKRIERVKNRGILLLPLLTTALERGLKMAESMEARSFSSRKAVRSVFYVKAARRDVMIFALQAASFMLFIFWTFSQVTDPLAAYNLLARNNPGPLLIPFTALLFSASVLLGGESGD